MRRLGLALAAVLLLVVPAAASAKAKTIAISGHVVSGGQSVAGMRVIALPTRGSAKSVRLGAKGTFALKMKASLVEGLSLQLIGKDGAYAGPVLLYANASKTRGATRLGAVARSVALGTVRLAGGYAKPVRWLPKAMVLTSGRGVLRLRAGAPLGAGRVGLVSSRPVAARSTRQGGGAVGAACTSSGAESGAGGDCDADGVPNAIDVDDNGNRTLDAVDRVSTQTTAKLNPFTGLRPDMRNTVNAYAGTDRAAINDFLGGGAGRGGALSLTLFLDQPYLEDRSSEPFDAVWVSCPPAMTWCSADDSPAQISGMSEFPRILPTLADDFESIAWHGYTGSTCRQGSPCVATDVAPSNALTAFYRSGSPAGSTPTWVSGVQPMAADTLAEVVPGDVFTLNARRGAQVTSIPVGITPYFVTSPALQSYTTSAGTTTVDYPLTDSSPGVDWYHPIVLGSDGLLTIRVWRPQRFALPGETEGAMYDIGGLHWGLEVDRVRDPDPPNAETRGSGEAGCAVSAPFGLERRAYNASSPDDPFNGIVPLVDATPTDTLTDTGAPTADGRLVGFTVDVKACAEAAGLPTTAGWGAALNLQGIGEALTGGANRTGLGLIVQFG